MIFVKDLTLVFLVGTSDARQPYSYEKTYF
jgi:hypothetical protein